MDKEIYVTGSYGLVASKFVELYQNELTFLTPEIDEVDITDKKTIKNYFTDKNLNAIVNFAALTDVSAAESQRNNKNGVTWKVNVHGAKNLAQLAKEKDCHFIQISTDYVFPGSKEFPGPYLETDTPTSDSRKLTWYGFTKAEGERVIRDILGENLTILRINYPVRAKFEGKLDYLRKPLKLFDEGKLYPLFTDQQVSISFVDEVSEAVKIILEKELKGIFHAASRDTSTPYELVSYLIKKTRGKDNIVVPNSIHDFIKKQKENDPDNPFVGVRYPIFGGLKVEKTEEALGTKFSTWRQIINKLVEQEIGES